MKQEPTNRLTIMVTDDCNLGCKNCVTSAQYGRLGSASIDTAFVSNVLERFGDGFKDRESGQLYLFFSGRGEPTLRMDVIEEIRRKAIGRYGAESVCSGIQTNGVFGHGVLERVVQNADIAWISVDGSPAYNDAIRRRGSSGSSKFVTENTPALIREGIDVRWRSTIHPLTATAEAQKSLVDYAERLGVQTVVVEPVIISPSKISTSPSIYLVNLEAFVEGFIGANTYAAAKGIQYVTGMMEDAERLFKPYTKRCKECFCVSSQPAAPKSATLTVDGRMVGCYLGYEDSSRMELLTFGRWDGGALVVDEERLSKLAGMQGGCVGRALLGNAAISPHILERLYRQAVYPSQMPNHS